MLSNKTELIAAIGATGQQEEFPGLRLMALSPTYQQAMMNSEDRGYKAALLSTLARTRALVKEGKL